MRRIELKKFGIYQLPDGSEVTVGASFGRGYSLYTTRSWRELGEADYLVLTDGKILRKGECLDWSAQDLVDTGRRVRPLRANRIL